MPDAGSGARPRTVGGVASLAHGVRILGAVARFRLDTVFAQLTAAHWSRWLLPTPWLPAPKTSTAIRLRQTLEHLGPVFIKFGQILSTRRDLLPADYADELARLQDRVPPFASDIAIARIERSLGTPIDELFGSFTREPLASASLAQVHAATLRNGEDVVVKVIRPDIERVITKDLALIYTIARLLERVSNDARRLRLREVVDDYERTIFGELNLLAEAANTAQLRRNFAASPLLYAPKVHWDLSARDVLVMERVHGVPISNIAELKRLGVDLKTLAERGVETFFTQVFQDNFFHADMHPGNIFVDVTDPADPSYIAIDCAIIGRLTDEDRAYLARNILAFFNQDYAQIAQLHVDSGWVPEGTDVADFEAVIRELCEPLFERPLAEISFGHFLVALFTTARRFNIEVQPQLVLLQKTLLNIEGLGRQLYPDLDLWATAKPFMERWMRERYGPGALMKRLLDEVPAFIEQLPQLAELIMTGARRLNDLDRIAKEQKRSVQLLTDAINTQSRRARHKRVAGAGFIVVGLGLLWGPLVAAISDGPDSVTVTAGVAAALIGSLLVGRA